jgi:AcrR family transcriptional regulator
MKKEFSLPQKKLSEPVRTRDRKPRGKPPAGQDPKKRRQITDAAHKVFLSQGYDVTSMEEIARVAGVSKATLYVYFKDKEELFVAITRESGSRLTAPIFTLDPGDHDVRAVLRRIGCGLAAIVTNPPVVRALRMIITMGDRIPELGKNYYEQGPVMGLARLSEYLGQQVEHGILKINDTHLAAAQFVEMAQATLSRPLLFGTGQTPNEERINYVVEAAVETFMAAYERQPPKMVPQG